MGKLGITSSDFFSSRMVTLTRGEGGSVAAGAPAAAVSTRTTRAIPNEPFHVGAMIVSLGQRGSFRVTTGWRGSVLAAGRGDGDVPGMDRAGAGANAQGVRPGPQHAGLPHHQAVANL